MKKIIEKVNSRKIFGRGAKVAPLSGGIINASFIVRRQDTDQAFILQKVKTGLGGITVQDYIRLADYLHGEGLPIPRILDHWTDEDGEWKVSECVPHARVRGPNRWVAGAVARYMSKMHQALRDCPFKPESSIPGFHDSTAIFETLAAHLSGARERQVLELGTPVLFEGRRLPVPKSPRQLIHGDPKFDNFLFGSSVERIDIAALIDWDTLMEGHVLVDLGDMSRSFCRENGNGFDPFVFGAICRNYTGGLEPIAHNDILNATKLITLELSARFLIDWFENRYFGWDPAKFPSRRASNLAAARRYFEYWKTMPEGID